MRVATLLVLLLCFNIVAETRVARTYLNVALCPVRIQRNAPLRVLHRLIKLVQQQMRGATITEELGIEL